MKRLPTLLSIFFLFIGNLAIAQNFQNIKGIVIDQQSEMTLIGANIEVINIDPQMGTTTDIDGSFILPDVPVGRHSVRITYLGYETVTIPNIVVTAGKEVDLEISMTESVIQINEVVVTAEVEKDKAINEMATISARTFSLEEVTRYSGGRNDVSRLVSNYAGVSTSNDSRNDIVIRGNSPTGVLWRLEGVPIPNPNHFSTLGTTGGPVSVVNPNLLKSSDFLTSAFPAEYGNATAGVFDLKFRNGNKDRFEFTAQLGAFSGIEAMVEGPLNRKGTSSFLVSYRHSFIELADALNIPIGTNATPNYRDLSYKLDFANTKIGKFSFFGILGTSNIDFIGAEVDENDLFADPTRDSYVTSNVGVIGLTHRYLINNNSYVKTTLMTSSNGNTYNEDMIITESDKRRHLELDDITNRISLNSYYNKKYSAKLTLRAGVLAEYYNISTFFQSKEFSPEWVPIRDFDGGVTLLQLYAQSQYRLNEKITLNTGLNFQWLTLNNSSIIEPRVALNYKAHPNHLFSIAYGLHSQMQPLPIYLYESPNEMGELERTNESLDFLKSHHFVVSYDWKPAKDWRLKSEVYYQLIRNAAVETNPSSFSVLNSGADFVFPEVGNLTNEGTGFNYGLELTLEKFFSQGYYGLFTASLFDSKYEGSDGIERNTAFNNKFVLNGLAGKEFKIGKRKQHRITLDLKVTYAGGRFYTPVDLASSQMMGQEVLFDELAFSEQNADYFRLDAKIGFQLNSSKKRFSQQFFLDFQNLTNNDNIFSKRYNVVTNEVNTLYQSGFFPDLLYRVQF